VPDADSASDDLARAIAGIEEEEIYRRNADGDRKPIGRLTQIKLIGKAPALESVVRHFGLFQDERSDGMQAFQINDCEYPYGANSRKRNHHEARDEFIDSVESNGTAKSA
jgi:hypothetical protein